MSSSFLEIVQLANGDIVLQSADEEREPLVNISFSEESLSYIGGAGLDIARAMIQAGIQAVARMDELKLIESELSDEEPNPNNRVLH